MLYYWILNSGFYMLNLNEYVSLQTESDESLSPYEWYRRLDHILQDTLQSLMKDGILFLTASKMYWMH